MKKNILFGIVVLLFAALNIQAQVCTVVVDSMTQKLPNDTLIVSSKSGVGISDSYLPCKSLKIDSAITVANTIYLRPGTSFITDSMSTLFGGYHIYVDSGATLDMNFKATLTLHYTTGSILIDTQSFGTKTFCSKIIFDYSKMKQDPNCIVLNISENKDLQKEIRIATLNNAWELHLPASQSNYQWQLFNAMGTLVMKGEDNQNILNIPWNALSVGLYILQMKRENQSVTFKLMRQ